MLIQATRTSGIAVYIAGEDDLRGAALTATGRHPDRIRLLDPVGYGPEFTHCWTDATLVVLTVTHK